MSTTSLPNVDTLDLSGVGLVPQRTDSPAMARRLVERDGAAILVGCGTGEADATDAVRGVVGPELRALPTPIRVLAGGEGDVTTANIDNNVRLSPHVDGWSYGDMLPDWIFLLCVEQAGEGGDSFLVDADALLDVLDDAAPDFVRFLRDEPIEQTEPGMHVSRAPVVRVTEAGRPSIRRHIDQRPIVDEQAPAVDRWADVTQAAGAAASRFKLAPGEMLCIDNYRILHGRDPYVGQGRLLWRLWAWTDAGFGVPEGALASDSRYARTEARASTVQPRRTADPMEAMLLTQIHGAAILTGTARDASAAVDTASAVLGERARLVSFQFGFEPEVFRLVREATPRGSAAIEPGDYGESTDTVRAFVAFFEHLATIRGPLSKDELLPVHVDGYVYGDQMPDYLFQSFVEQSGEGGETVLLDAPALVESIDDPELVDFLWNVPVDQTEPGGHPLIRPILVRHPSGRVQAIHHDFQVPAPDSATPEHDRAMIARWSELVVAAATDDPGFKVEAGETLCIDNFRVMHTRKAYKDESRELFVSWAWTPDAPNLPTWDLFTPTPA